MKRLARFKSFVAAAKELKKRESHRRNVVRCFLEFTKGCSGADWNVLLNCGLGQPGVYVYSVETKSARIPAPGELSWHVEFMLRAHKKHILKLQKRPPLQKVSLALVDFVSKVRWAAYFSGSSSANWSLGRRAD